jgi:two-component system sensor histidine kinase TctE
MLRSQLLWRLLPSVLVVILVASVFAYRLSLDMATEAYDAALFDSARSLAQQIEVSGGARPSLALPRAAEEILLFDPHDRIYYRVAAADGSTVAGDERLPMPPMQLTGELPVRFYDTHVGGEKVRASAYALFTQGEHPAGTVIFAETMVKRRHLLERILVTLVLPLVIITVLAAALVWYGVRSGLAPLNDLASALARRGSSDLRPVATDRVPGEVRPAVEAFNNLMTRVEAAQSAQQRFLSEAAHQLRTPLAGLSAQLDRALRAQDYEALKPALDQLRGASRRVTRLVNQLLTIARAEPGADPSREFTEFDLAALVQATCREWVPDALAAGVDLGFAGDPGPVRVLGHEAFVGEILNNLIDNALRYGARAGQAVTVRLTCDPQPELSVEDEGPGVPAEERTRIFERFHRVAGSGTGKKDAGGAGLGLAIVREIARTHGAEAWVEPGADGRGAVFRVRFPPQKMNRRPSV